MNNAAEHGREILRAIDPTIAQVNEEHKNSRKLWMPTELLPEEFEPQELPPEIIAMKTLNLLTEDGLPYFKGLLVYNLGPEHAIWDWSRTWTAEEDRHGAAIKSYMQRTLSREQMIGVERLQHQYLETGFWPNWGRDPIKLIAYVVLQEKATQVSHAGIARLAANYDPVLRTLLGKISGEEGKHHGVYYKFLEAAKACDPSHVLMALQHVIKSFAMPGKNIPVFAELSEIQMKFDVFGPKEYLAIVDDVIKKMGVETLSNLTDDGKRARDRIFGTLKALERAAESAEKKPSRSIHLQFLGDDFIVSI